VKTIQVLCQVCQGSFDFRHPSVNSAVDLMNVTIDCRNCGAVLKAPNDQLMMTSIEQYTARQMREAGVEVPESMQVGYVEIDQGDLADVIQLKRKITPAVMPPHPPAPKKPFVRKPHLTQRIGDAATINLLNPDPPPGPVKH
jgi:hypothetical protein